MGRNVAHSGPLIAFIVSSKTTETVKKEAAEIATSSWNTCCSFQNNLRRINSYRRKSTLMEIVSMHFGLLNYLH